MENASKALIIAGAILLAIAIIGIGMYVYQNAADAMSGTDMTDQKVSTYNQTFLNYEGTQRGSAVKTMCNTIANHNRTATDLSEKVQIKYGDTNIKDVDAKDLPNEDKGTGTSTTVAITTKGINDIRNDVIQSAVSYDIDFGYDSTSGMITTVYINKLGSSSSSGSGSGSGSGS